MSVATPFKGGNHQAGLIAFQPQAARDAKFITHAASDVLAHVLEGRGRLRLGDTEMALEPGSVCHIPANTAHDFVAEGDAPLLLFYANVAYTWAAAPDARRVRFGADHGSATLANLQHDGRASLQIVGPGNLVFLVKGAAQTIKDRIAAAPFRLALMELAMAEAKDQAWPGVTVAPLAYEWPADQREAMRAMESQ
jgi:quercetin dioxygenase-like cupin family protein